jgi:hypothetical protein
MPHHEMKITIETPTSLVSHSRTPPFDKITLETRLSHQSAACQKFGSHSLRAKLRIAQGRHSQTSNFSSQIGAMRGPFGSIRKSNATLQTIKQLWHDAWQLWEAKVIYLHYPVRNCARALVKLSLARCMIHTFSSTKEW